MATTPIWASSSGGQRPAWGRRGSMSLKEPFLALTVFLSIPRTLGTMGPWERRGAAGWPGVLVMLGAAQWSVMGTLLPATGAGGQPGQSPSPAPHPKDKGSPGDHCAFNSCTPARSTTLPTPFLPLKKASAGVCAGAKNGQGRARSERGSCLAPHLGNNSRSEERARRKRLSSPHCVPGIASGRCTCRSVHTGT